VLSANSFNISSRIAITALLMLIGQQKSNFQIKIIKENQKLSSSFLWAGNTALLSVF
jgi:DNA-binding IscR family transcriptional regulator